jgi:hypothetical protein
MPRREAACVRQLVQNARSLTPYLLIELLLPGGTLIALLLWLFRRKFAVNGEIQQSLAAPARY